MPPSSAAAVRDNWERLMAAVLKREQFRQLCYEQSRSPSISTTPSDLSDQISNLQHISVSPSQVSNTASRSIRQRLFASWFRRRKPKNKYLVDIPDELGIYLAQVRRFSLHELKVATKNFSNRIESADGYNVVYRGRLSDGSPVAVKRYKNRGDQIREEVEINGITSHPNLLRLVGFCVAPNERLLVYPWMVNGSVATWLRGGRHERLPPLNWAMRKRIALGTARGLAYLHSGCDKKIIHRGVKAANILLDDNFEAVLVKFELGLIMDHNFVSTFLAGTTGDRTTPDYLSTFTCIEKIDVFGYGMFVLELVTRHRVSDLAWLSIYEEMAPLDWVKRKYKERKWKMLADAEGGDDMDEVVEQLVQIALVCTQITPEKRPTMPDVMQC